MARHRPKAGSGDSGEERGRRGHTRRPFQRMYEIHRIIAAGRYPNCTQLALRFEVSPKTVQRDIDFMRDEFQMPIAYDEKRHGFYFEAPVEEFPGVAVGADELAAMFLARTALESIRGTALEGPLREVFARFVKPLEGMVELKWPEMDEVFTRKAPMVRVAEVRGFGQLAQAVIEQREVKFHYRKLAAEAAEARRVRPYHLGEVDGGVYLIAWDLEREALRTFALPRMSRIQVTASRFQKPGDFDGREHLRQSFGVWHHGAGAAMHRVRVRLKGYAARMAQERRWHPTQEIDRFDEKGELVEVRFEVSALEEVVRWVLSFGSRAEVAGPPELKEMVREELEKMLGNLSEESGEEIRPRRDGASGKT